MEERNARGETLEEFLANYDETKYRRPSCSVDMILMTVHEKVLKVLLMKRQDHPFIGDWGFPGGFVNFEEDMDDAVVRGLKEETHITKNTYFRQLYTLGNADRDPRTRIITTVYLSLTPEENLRRTKEEEDEDHTAWFTICKKVTDSDDQGRVSLLSLDCEEKDVHIVYQVKDRAMHNYIETRSELLDCSNAQLAGDHIKALNMAMDMVQHRAASTGILFNLLPEECTLREIQTAYEAVIGRTVDTANFRRDIRRMLKETGRKKKVNGKNVALYRFDPMYAYLEENL